MLSKVQVLRQRQGTREL